MNELTFLLILAGIGVVLLVAMFTYYKHHKKINDEIKGFNHHAHDMDDVLLNGRTNSPDSDDRDIFSDDLPGSFSASRQEHFDVDDIHLRNDSLTKKTVDSTLSETSSVTPSTTSTSSIPATSPSNPGKRPSTIETSAVKGELVDGVYINTKRVISSSAVSSPYPETAQASEPARPLKTFASSSLAAPITETPPAADNSAQLTQTQTQTAESSIADNRLDSNTALKKIKVVYDPVPEGVKELIISHTILSKGEHFSGSQLFHALASAGLHYGEMDIFHYPGDDSEETFALFSVANVVEPGTFNPQEAEALKTPGISMFMRLPTRMGSYNAYDKFIHVAQAIAAELNAELCDETRSQLTQQAIAYKKEQIRKLNFDMAKAEKLAGITH